MDNLEGVWHGLVFTWPAKLVLSKDNDEKKIKGEIKYFDT